MSPKMRHRHRLIPTLLLAATASLHAKTSTDPYARELKEGLYPDEIKHPVPDDLSKFKQPASLVADLQAIQTGSIDDRVKALAAKSLRDQVFVKGGEFMMGDFGPLQSKEKLPWDGHADSKPLHKVTLDSYSISKYKVTVGEFDVYTDANKLPRVLMGNYARQIGDTIPPWRAPNKPVFVPWDQAKAYCRWLGTITHHVFDLPTEAQWEYAARDHGRFIVIPTNNGKIEWNVNLPDYGLIEKMSSDPEGSPYPIALFPPSPLGLFDLAKNDMEWINDWYSPTYYQESNGATNPTGPSTGTEKVLRSWPEGDSGTALTMSRRKSPLVALPPQVDSSAWDGLRCAVQEPIPVKP